MITKIIFKSKHSPSEEIKLPLKKDIYDDFSIIIKCFHCCSVNKFDFDTNIQNLNTSFNSLPPLSSRNYSLDELENFCKLIPGTIITEKNELKFVIRKNTNRIIPPPITLFKFCCISCAAKYLVSYIRGIGSEPEKNALSIPNSIFIDHIIKIP